MFVKGPTNHAGNKIRLLHRLIPMFGDLREHTFIDLCTGGMNVGLNVDAKRVVFNDVHPHVTALNRLFSSSDHDVLVAEVEAMAARYGLSDSVANGYDGYGTDSSRGLAAHNRAGFLQLRADFNEGRLTGRDQEVGRFLLVVFGYNNHIQIRGRDGFWTNSVGKRDFNTNVRQNVADTMGQLASIEHEVTQLDFREFNATQYASPFVYIDPPYSISAATYNRSWQDSDDEALWSFLDQLTMSEVPWMMSNVLAHRGRRNDPLLDWATTRGYRLIDLDHDYVNVSHNHAQVSRTTREVLVTSSTR